jgi:hypothetical protein
MARKPPRGPKFNPPTGPSVSPNGSGQYITPKPGTFIGGGYGAAAAQLAPKKKKGKGGAPGPAGPPGIEQFLAGDTTYNDQYSQLQKQLEQFRTSNASQQGMVNQDFQTALDKMTRQKGIDTSNMTSDYGARGLLNSGLFTKSLGDYDTNYQQQFNDLNTSKGRSLQQLLEDLSNYQTENQSSLLSAKQDAIRRRAQKYGITSP